MIAMTTWRQVCRPLRSLWLLPLLGLMACGPQLRATPGVGVQLSGRWLMQEQERAQLMAGLKEVLQQADAKQQRRARRDQRNQPPSESGEMPVVGDAMPDGISGGMPGMGPAAMNNWEQRERQEQQDAFLLAVVPSRTLTITQHSSARLELAPESAALRRFVVGETSTIVSSFDTLTVHSGWQGDEFVVYATGKEQSLKVTERYRRTGNELLVVVNITMAGIKAQTLQARYQLQ